MRIVHVADSFAPDVGGIERQVELLVRHQLAQGHDVTVITAVAEPAPLDADLDVVRAATGRWLTVAFPWRNRRIVNQVLDGRPIDIIHAHFTVISPMAVYVTRAAGRRRLPVAATVHSLWWQVAAATRMSLLPFGWGPMRAAWSAVSSTAAEQVRRTLPRVRHVGVVPNLINTEFWRHGIPTHREPSAELRVVLVGRLKKRKHLDEIIDVLARVREQVAPDTQLSVSIVGDGPRREDLQQQIDRNGLNDWISLPGYRDAAYIRALHHRSHLFIASSRQEAFGIAAFEARAAGLPVMGYTSTGLGDYISHGVDGLLVSDSADMVQTLVNLITRPETLRDMLRTTSRNGPAITTADADQAIAELYERARATTTDHRSVRLADRGPRRVGGSPERRRRHQPTATVAPQPWATPIYEPPAP